MATIRCPACREKVQPGAVKCRHCKHDFTPEQAEVSRKAQANNRVAQAIVGIGLVGLVGWCAMQPPATPQQQREATALLGLPPPASAVEVKTDDAFAKPNDKEHCANRYADNFSMRAACGRNAAEGRADFVRIWNANLGNDQFIAALTNCYSRYLNGGVVNFSMAGACARNQEEGLRATQ